MGKVQSNKERKCDIVLALFWRFGYWLCSVMFLSFFVEGDNFFIGLGCCMIVYAIYSFTISQIPTRHFLLGMLSMEHRPMRLEGSSYNQDTLNKWKKDIIQISIVLSVLGICLIVLSF